MPHSRMIAAELKTPERGRKKTNFDKAVERIAGSNEELDRREQRSRRSLRMTRRGGALATTAVITGLAFGVYSGTDPNKGKLDTTIDAQQQKKDVQDGSVYKMTDAQKDTLHAQSVAISEGDALLAEARRQAHEAAAPEASHEIAQQVGAVAISTEKPLP